MISVIIPVYNVEKYLVKCIDSILNQSYKELQIILVDDGSTDNSGAICDYYANKYSNIEVLHKKNEGPSIARNKGLALVKGEYVSFIDSDDFLEKDIYKNFIDAIELTNADLAICNRYDVIENEDGSYTKKKNEFFVGVNELTVFKDEELFTKVYPVTVTLWNKLFRFEMIKNMRFNDAISYAEDHLFTLEVLINAKSAVFIPYYGYNYINQRKDSIVSSSISDSSLQLLNVVVQNYEKLSAIGYPSAGINRIWSAVNEVMRKIPDRKDSKYIKYINASKEALKSPKLQDKIAFLTDNTQSRRVRIEYADINMLGVIVGLEELIGIRKY